MKRLNLFVPLVIFLGLGLFLLKGLEKDPNAMPSALLDKPVPSFELAVLGGDSTVNAQVIRGRPALINVWATWCAPCRIEHPFLNELKARGVRIIGVNYKDEPKAAIGWLKAKGDPYELSVMDLNGKLGLDLGVFGAPETYLVDSAGIIRAKHVGILNETVWQQKLQDLWQQYSQKPLSPEQKRL